MNLLFYHSSQVESGLVTLDDVRAARAALSRSLSEQSEDPSGVSVFLRDATVFGGSTEDATGVFLLGGDSEQFAVVVEAFEEAGIEVQDFAIPAVEGEGEGQEAEKAGTLIPPTDDDFAKLKAEATRLKIQFAANIGYESLKARVDIARAKEEKDAAQ